MVEIGSIYKHRNNPNYYICVVNFVKLECVRVMEQNNNYSGYCLFTQGCILRDFIKAENTLLELEMLLGVYD